MIFFFGKQNSRSGRDEPKFISNWDKNSIINSLNFSFSSHWIFFSVLMDISKNQWRSTGGMSEYKWIYLELNQLLVWQIKIKIEWKFNYNLSFATSFNLRLHSQKKLKSTKNFECKFLKFPNPIFCDFYFVLPKVFKMITR